MMKLVGYLALISVALAHHGKEPTPLPRIFSKAAPLPILKKAPIFPTTYQCSEPETTCDHGFTLVGNACEKEIITGSENICKIGNLNGKECILQVPTIPTCPKGYTLQNNSCLTVTTAPIIQYCPDGFAENGKTGCSKTIPVPLVEFCARGVQQKGGCVITHRTAPIITSYCPPTFEDEDGECCRIDTYDCTPADAEPLDCNDGDDDCYNGKRVRNLHGKALPPVEITKEVAVIQQTCQKRVVTPKLVNTSCAAGELIGGACVTKEIIPMESKCTALGGKDGCHRVVGAPIQTTCPDGFNQSGNICTAQSAIPTEPSCQAGFDLSGDICLKTMPSTPICREGRLGADNLCHDKEFAPSTTTWCTTCKGSHCVQQQCHKQISIGKGF